MWDNNVISVENILKTRRWICLDMYILQEGFRCSLCLLYAPNDQRDRAVFWDQLRMLYYELATPIIFMGGFNEVLPPEERKHATRLTLSMREFGDWVQNLGLVDIKTQNKKFTWRRANSASKLDEFFVAHEWLVMPVVRKSHSLITWASS